MFHTRHVTWFIGFCIRSAGCAVRCVPVHGKEHCATSVARVTCCNRSPRQSTRCVTHCVLRLASYRAVSCVLRFVASLTPVSTSFLHQESAASDYLRQATCVTLGVMLNFDTGHDFAAKRTKWEFLYEVVLTHLAASPSLPPSASGNAWSIPCEVGVSRRLAPPSFRSGYRGLRAAAGVTPSRTRGALQTSETVGKTR